jgi:hypothetical protein
MDHVNGYIKSNSMKQAVKNKFILPRDANPPPPRFSSIVSSEVACKEPANLAALSHGNRQQAKM